MIHCAALLFTFIFHIVFNLELCLSVCVCLEKKLYCHLDNHNLYFIVADKSIYFLYFVNALLALFMLFIDACAEMTSVKIKHSSSDNALQCLQRHLSHCTMQNLSVTSASPSVGSPLICTPRLLHLS